MRPYADRMMELMIGTARASTSLAGPDAAAAARGEAGGDRRDHRRPRAGRRVQRTGPEARLRARPPASLGGRRGALARLRPEGPLDPGLPPLRDRSGVDRLQRPPVLPRCTGDRAPDHRALRERRGRSRRARLQPLRLRADADRSSSRTCSRSRSSCSSGTRAPRPRSALLGDFIYEPEPEEILARLLPVYVETELYRALLESAASEQGARMTAMRNASSNAGDLIEQPHARHEPRPPGGDHPGDPGGRCGRRRPDAVGGSPR